MAISLDKFVLGPLIANDTADDVQLEMDFVGFFNDWTSTNISDCQTSSRWTECHVNTYHLCGQDVAKMTFPHAGWTAWWGYSLCLFKHQYGQNDELGLECGGLNPRDANHTCSPDQFLEIAATISQHCAVENRLGMDGAQKVRQCHDDGTGVGLLKQSNKASLTMPKNTKGYIEPEWIQVNGPSCEEGGWEKCGSSFDKTSCMDWDHCSSDDWAKHIATLVPSLAV